MRFAFTDDQLAFRDAVRDLLEKECPPARRARRVDERRPAERPAVGRSSARWACVGMLAPEAHGGLGLDEVDLVLILEETGSVRAAGADRRDALRRRAAVVEPRRRSTRRASGITAGAVGRHRRRRSSLADDERRLLDRARRARRSSPRPSVDGAPRGSVDVRRAPGDVTESAARRARRPRSTAARSAPRRSCVGLAERMLDMTVEYVKERKQFGVPIGSFQAVKHHLADARIALEFARPLVYRAAYSLTHGDPDASVHVSMAKAKAADAALARRPAALQCHGAIGYTTEYDLHLYMKRAWALAVDVGRRAPGTGAASPARSCSLHRTRSCHDRGLHRRRRPHARRASATAGSAKVHPADLGAHSIRALMSSASTSIPRRSTTSCSAASTRSARRPATSRARAGSPPGCPTRCRAPRSTGSAARRQQAVHFAAQAVMCGTDDLVVAGGVQNMSMIPISVGDARRPSSSASPTRSRGREGWDARYGTQEVVAVPRRGDDRREVGHHARRHGGVRGRVARARAPGAAPRAASSARSSRSAGVDHDEGPREPNLDKIRSLPPLVEGGRLTAAVATQISDAVGRDADREPSAR